MNSYKNHKTKCWFLNLTKYGCSENTRAITSLRNEDCASTENATENEPNFRGSVVVRESLQRESFSISFGNC